MFVTTAAGNECVQFNVNEGTAVYRVEVYDDVNHNGDGELVGDCLYAILPHTKASEGSGELALQLMKIKCLKNLVNRNTCGNPLIKLRLSDTKGLPQNNRQNKENNNKKSKSTKKMEIRGLEMQI